MLGEEVTPDAAPFTAVGSAGRYEIAVDVVASHPAASARSAVRIAVDLQGYTVEVRAVRSSVWRHDD